MQTQKLNNTRFWAYLYYSAGTQHGNLYQSSVTTSRVTYFILRAQAQELELATANTGNTWQIFFEKMHVNWPEK